MKKEIEYGTKIKNPKELTEIFKQRAETQRIINITRSILKNNGKYFIKVSSEIVGSKQYYVISLKEDLLANGITNKMKTSDELDIEVSKEQFQQIIKMLKMLGFKKVSTFKKIRHEYKIKGLTVTIDKYKEGPYLEIEGPSSVKIKEFIKTIPIQTV